MAHIHALIPYEWPVSTSNTSSQRQLVEQVHELNSAVTSACFLQWDQNASSVLQIEALQGLPGQVALEVFCVAKQVHDSQKLQQALSAGGCLSVCLSEVRPGSMKMSQYWRLVERLKKLSPDRPVPHT